MQVVLFDETTELQVPQNAATSGPAAPGTILAANADGLLDPSLLPAGGTGVNPPQRSVTVSTAIEAGDGSLWVDATSGPLTLNLPDATTVPGKTYTIKKVDMTDNTVSIFGGTGQTIDGQTSNILSQPNQFVTVQSSGTVWYVVDNNAPYDEETGLLTPGVNDVAYAQNMVVDLAEGPVVYIHLDGPVTSCSFINGTPNLDITVLLAQGGSGQHPFTWPVNFEGGGEVIAGTAATASGAVCLQTFTYLTQTGKYVASSNLLTTQAAPNRGTPGVNQVVGATNISVDLTVADVIKISFSQAVASSVFVNPRPCQRITVILADLQEGPGSFVWPQNFINAATDTEAPTGSIGIQSFVYVETLAAFFAVSEMLIVSAATLAAIVQPTGAEQLQVPVGGVTDLYLPLTAAVASSAFNGGVTGQYLHVFLAQNATGGFQFTWPTNVLDGGTISSSAGTANPNSIANQELIYLSDYNAYIATSALFYTT